MSDEPLTNENLAERQREAMVAYTAGVRDARHVWEDAMKPTDVELAIIRKIYPGWRDPIETYMDLSINVECLKQLREIMDAIREHYVLVAS